MRTPLAETICDDSTARPNALFALVLLAVVLRLAIPISAELFTRTGPQIREPDSTEYVELADSLAKGTGFNVGGKPSLTRTPGYPLLLVPGVLGEQINWWAIALQALLGGATAYYAGRLAAELFGSPRAGIIAAALFACEPVSILYAGKVLTEASCAFFIMCFVRWGERYARGRVPKWLWASMVMLLVATYIRPITLFLPIVAFAILAIGSRKKTIAPLIASLVAVYAVLGLWHMRNWSTANYAGFSAISDVNLFYYHAADVKARTEGRSLSAVQEEWGYPEKLSGADGAKFREIRGEAKRIITASPGEFVKSYGAGMANVMLDPGVEGYRAYFSLPKEADGDLGNRGFTARVKRLASNSPTLLVLHAGLRIYLWLLLAFAAIGLFAMISKRFRTGWLVVAVVIYMWLLSGGAVGYHRFRVPLTPPLCVLAAGGAEWLLRKRSPLSLRG